jgi:hypothetical protein
MKFIKNVLIQVALRERDVLTFGGLLLMGVGCWMIYRPAGFIVVGVGLLGIGLGWLIRRLPAPEIEKEGE